VELAERAAHGVEEHADQAAKTACLLADVTSGGEWSAAAAVTAAASTIRRRLGLPVEPEAMQGGTVAVSAPRHECHTRDRRRGLEPGFRGIR
jgi:hypothetical protein